VFPWVLADVTSTSLNLNAPATFRDLRKPVGALNEKRLAIFRERYDSMEPGQRFLYGTHYSAPAFVSYFLLRLAPELTLHLHGGSFDTADREFTSISEAWHSVLSSSSDVKELIPHFYHPPSASFLLNGRHLDLGVRSDGTPVGDVLLPPWASDATDFVTKCRAALESELCSSQLHRWIDLIFGYSQRGIAADEAHTGGRLLAILDDGLHEIRREEGEATVHPSDVLHAVTAVREGVRYSLLLFFFLEALAHERTEYVDHHCYTT
jgi:factor associated with neutral sphingomyelinase activation